MKVGDPVPDHQCWIRPENMRTPRTVLKIDENAPGTEIAAETAAAMAASSMVFRGFDRAYARRLLNKAKLVHQCTFSVMIFPSCARCKLLAGRECPMVHILKYDTRFMAYGSAAISIREVSQRKFRWRMPLLLLVLWLQCKLAHSLYLFQ